MLLEQLKNSLETCRDRCFKNCDVVDLTFACIGGIDAVENCLDWIKINPEKKAV